MDKEITPVKAELINDLKTKENAKPLIQGLGMYAVKGGPGRPKGLLNQATQAKNGAINAYIKAGGLKRYEKIVKEGTDSQFIELTKTTFSLFPKESKLDVDVNSTERTINLFFPGEIKNPPLENQTSPHKAEDNESDTNKPPIINP